MGVHAVQVLLPAVPTPRDVADIHAVVGEPRRDEQPICKPVQIAKCLSTSIRLVERARDPLRTPADRPSHVKMCRRNGPTREDEAGQRREDLLHLVDRAFQCFDPGCRRAGKTVTDRSETGIDVEEICLNPMQFLVERRVGPVGPNHAQNRCELVYGTVGVNLRRMLGNATIAEKRSEPIVAFTGVDFH